MVILHLVKAFRDVHTKLDRLVLMQVPAHVVIEANEKADSSAKLGPFATCPFGGISPKDFPGCSKVRTRKIMTTDGIVVSMLRTPNTLISISTTGLGLGMRKCGLPAFAL